MLNRIRTPDSTNNEVIQISRISHYYLPIFVYIAIILALSTIPSKSIPEIKTTFPFDKLAHFIEYGVFTIILFRAFVRSGSLPAGKVAVLVVLSAAAMGIIDEIYQYFTGRNSDLYDWFADCLGSVTASLFCMILNMKLRNNKSEKRWNFWLRNIVCHDEREK